MSEMRVNIETLKDAISTFETKKANLEIAYLKMSNEVRELDGTWHGEASEKFKAQFEELYNNLKATEERMDGAIQKLRTAVDVYTDVDTQNRNLAEAAAEGNVSIF